MMEHEDLQWATDDYAPVLVINDDRIQLAVLTSILRKGGIACEGMTSAEQALRSMRPETPPPMIISDLHMPGIDGWRFCRLLRSREFESFNHLPNLVISATFAGENTREITTATGADAFLPAPVNPDRLFGTVKGLLRGKSARPAPRAQHEGPGIICVRLPL